MHICAQKLEAGLQILKLLARNQSLAGASQLFSQDLENLTSPPAHGRPLLQACDAPLGEDVDVEPGWDVSAQMAPDDEVDQRTGW